MTTPTTAVAVMVATTRVVLVLVPAPMPVPVPVLVPVLVLVLVLVLALEVLAKLLMTPALVLAAARLTRQLRSAWCGRLQTLTAPPNMRRRSLVPVLSAVAR